MQEYILPKEAVSHQMSEELFEENSQIPDPETWVEQYGDYLYAYALSRTRDPATAEDMVQETFLAALSAYKNFKGHSSTATWFIAILRHKVIDYFRKMNREVVVNDIDSHIDSVDEFFDEKGKWKLKPAEWGINPTKFLEKKEFWEVISRCLSDLPARSAQVFRFREMDGLSCKEICNILGISASNCYVILYRARMHLRRCFEINWFDTSSSEDS
jgi:RNA polymerase sigma-70 factor (TIGR02943 family)